MCSGGTALKSVEQADRDFFVSVEAGVSDVSACICTCTHPRLIEYTATLVVVEEVAEAAGGLRVVARRFAVHFRNYTLAFENAVADLPVTFDGAEENFPCSVEQWRQDHSVEACQVSNIPTWISFIEQFGTHYTVRLFAGEASPGGQRKVTKEYAFVRSSE